MRERQINLSFKDPTADAAMNTFKKPVTRLNRRTRELLEYASRWEKMAEKRRFIARGGVNNG